MEIQRKKRFHQDIFRPSNPSKVITTNGKLPYYRSGWENSLMMFLDLNEKVIRWGSECITIPYLLPNGESHRYITDFYVEIYDNDNNIRKYIIEVKPKAQSHQHSRPPKAPKVRTQKSMHNYQQQLTSYYKNAYKWKAAEEYCRSNNLKFLVLTEDNLVI